MTFTLTYKDILEAKDKLKKLNYHPMFLYLDFYCKNCGTLIEDKNKIIWVESNYFTTVPYCSKLCATIDEL